MSIPVFLERPATEETIRDYQASVANALQANAKRIQRLKRARNYERDVEALKDEVKALEWMVSLGYDVVKSEVSDDIELDIDFYIDGHSVSFKAEHDGMKPNQWGRRYFNIYFELATQKYTGHSWDDPTEIDWVNEDSKTTINDRWNPAWFLYGKAEYYLILQCGTLSLYRKMDILKYVHDNGWQKKLSLSRPVLVRENGLDSVCGYLDNRKVPFVARWTLFDSDVTVAA